MHISNDPRDVGTHAAPMLDWIDRTETVVGFLAGRATAASCSVQPHRSFIFCRILLRSIEILQVERRSIISVRLN